MAALLLGFCALGSLFLKLPNVAETLGLKYCTSCNAASPILPMISASYFAFLITAILTFAPFSTLLAQMGLIFSVGLGFTLTYFNPEWCGVCLFAHSTHILLWFILLAAAEDTEREKDNLLGSKLALLFIAPVAMMALFSTLNFTLLIYGLSNENPLGSLVQAGDIIKPFQAGKFSNENFADYSGTLFTFVSPNCPYCKELLPSVEALAKEYEGKRVNFVSVGRVITEESKQLAPHLTWIEDKKGEIIPQFGVTGFPTTVLVDATGRVIKSLPGAPSDYAEDFRASLDLFSK